MDNLVEYLLRSKYFFFYENMIYIPYLFIYLFYIFQNLYTKY